MSQLSQNQGHVPGPIFLFCKVVLHPPFCERDAREVVHSTPWSKGFQALEGCPGVLAVGYLEREEQDHFCGCDFFLR